MSETDSTTRVETRDPPDEHPIVQVLLAIRGSFLYAMAAFGVIIILTGVLVGLLVTPDESLMLSEASGLAVISGASLVLYGILGRLVLRAVGYTN